MDSACFAFVLIIHFQCKIARFEIRKTWRRLDERKPLRLCLTSAIFSVKKTIYSPSKVRAVRILYDRTRQTTLKWTRPRNNTAPFRPWPSPTSPNSYTPNKTLTETLQLVFL